MSEEQKKPNLQFRVIGFRPGGECVSLGNGLTSEEAKRIRAAIADANIFAEIHIELETDHDGES